MSHDAEGRDADNKLIVREARGFLDKYIDSNPFLCKLSALHAAWDAVKRYGQNQERDPKEVFEVMYKVFGNSLFSQYTESEDNYPTAIQLQRTRNRSFAPAAHYFTASAALWKYAKEYFPIDAIDADAKGYTALMAAVQDQRAGTVPAMLDTARVQEKRVELVSRANYMGDTVVHIIASQINIVNCEDYLAMARAILTSFSLPERIAILEIQDRLGATPLQSVAKRLMDEPENHLISLRDLLLASIGIPRDRRRQ